MVRLLEQAKDLSSLVAIHNRHGEDALITAHEMLTREQKIHTKYMGQVQELPLRAKTRREVVYEQAVRILNIEAAMEFCNKLAWDIAALPQDVKKIKIKVNNET